MKSIKKYSAEFVGTGAILVHRTSWDSLVSGLVITVMIAFGYILYLQ